MTIAAPRLLVTVALLLAAPQASIAQVVADGSTATSVTVNTDGSVTVGVAPVTRNGVSLNRYDALNVAPPGLVLDNRVEAARTIVNEVTGTGTTTIAGDVRVEGQAAHVIIANPNGIVVDGARFFNTGRVALTTGQIGTSDRLIAPGITQMNVTATVTGGTITVEGGGLSGQMDAVDLIARSIRVGGAITNESTAEGAGIFLSAGQSRSEFESAVLPGNVDQSWRRVTGTGGTGDGYLIELTRPGVLGANRIGLQVTDAGAGVRMAGTALAAAREFSVSASGEVVVEGARLGGKGGLSVSGGAVRITDSALESGAGTVTLESAGPLSFGGSTAVAGNALVLGSGGVMTLTDSRLRASGHVLVTAADLSLSSPTRRSELVSEGGSVLASVTRGDMFNDGGLIQGAQRITDPVAGLTGAQGAVTLNIAGRLVNRSGAELAVVFGAAGDVVITTGGDVVNQRGRLISGRDVRIASVGDVLNLTDLPGLDVTPAVQQGSRPGKRLWWTLWLKRERIVETTLDFGELLRPDRLGTITATGSVQIAARAVINRGGEINANGGDLGVTALRVETIGLGSGRIRIRQVCGLGCVTEGDGSALFHGGQINAAGSVTIKADESMRALASGVYGGSDVTITSPSVRVETIPLPMTVPRPRGMFNLFAAGTGWTYWRDMAASLTASAGRLAILSAAPVQVVGGDLRGGTVLIPGGQTLIRLPDDLSQARRNGIGWFRALPGLR